MDVWKGNIEHHLEVTLDLYTLIGSQVIFHWQQHKQKSSQIDWALTCKMKMRTACFLTNFAVPLICSAFGPTSSQGCWAAGPWSKVLFFFCFMLPESTLTQRVLSVQCVIFQCCRGNMGNESSLLKNSVSALCTKCQFFPIPACFPFPAPRPEFRSSCSYYFSWDACLYLHCQQFHFVTVILDVARGQKSEDAGR